MYLLFIKKMLEKTKKIYAIDRHFTEAGNSTSSSFDRKLLGVSYTHR